MLITKVLTELAPSVAGQPALHPPPGKLSFPSGPHDGLIADVLHYAGFVKEHAWRQLSDVFPAYDDGKPVTAWLWCRTIKCPNPACGAHAPLIDGTVVSRKRGMERQVVIDFDGAREPSFTVVPHLNGRITSTVERSGAICAACDTPIPFPYIRAEGKSGRLHQRLMAMVIDRENGRDFVDPDPRHEAVAGTVEMAEAVLRVPLVSNPRDVKPTLYGGTTHADLYTARQSVLLDAFADGVSRAAERVEADGGDRARAEAVAAVLALCVGKLAQYGSMQALIGPTSSITRFQSGFTRQVIQMTWDFCEVNPFAGTGPSWEQIVTTALRAIPFAPTGRGVALQRDARDAVRSAPANALFATDPPYFDQIGYADLSDYFYVWLRRALRGVFPDLFATLATPKDQELIALPFRHGGDKAAARDYFVEGFTETFHAAASAQTSDAPMLVVYAFREQGKTTNGDIAPGWEAILEAMIAADLMIVGTWPIHGTGSTRMISMGTNALASYVVLVCRPRPDNAPRTTRSDLARLLRSELTAAIPALQHANIAPVDLAQAVIGPGMQVYSRHSSVVETDGLRVGVAAALALINRTLAEVLDEQEGDLDPDSRWAVTWYDDHGFDKAPFGKADQLARAKGIAVNSLVEAGIVTSGAGRVALIGRDALRPGWDPATDRRATAWEAVQYLVRALDEGGERAAAALYARLGGLADPARELAYRLFQIAEKSGRTDEAIAYNGLVTSWSEIARLADDLPRQPTATTESLF